MNNWERGERTCIGSESSPGVLSKNKFYLNAWLLALSKQQNDAIVNKALDIGKESLSSLP